MGQSPSTSGSRSMARVPSLDGLRGLSILLVVVGHVAGTAGMPAVLDRLHNLGNWGVKFFFVISGFIITKLLIEEKERRESIGFARFYLRRTAKVFPAYFTYIAFVALSAWKGWIELMPGDLVHALTFTMNFHIERGWFLNHTWSLGVEEQFYLCWPLIVLMCRRPALMRVCIGVLVAVPLIRAHMWFNLSSSPTSMTRALPAAADAMAAGALLCLLLDRWRTSWPRSIALGYALLAAAFVLPALSFALRPGAFYIWGQSVMIVFIAGVVMHCVLFPDEGIGRLMNSRFLVLHGLISYSLYLWQEPFLNSTEVRWFTTAPVNLALAYACGIGSYWAIERPARMALIGRYERWTGRIRHRAV
jgi:peptidoglycan/LPS O-acetylase OafA/YrhL